MNQDTKETILGALVVLCTTMMVLGAFNINTGFGMIAMGAIGIFTIMAIAD